MVASIKIFNNIVHNAFSALYVYSSIEWYCGRLLNEEDSLN